VTTFLVDHNMEGQAALLWDTLAADGWLELVALQLVTFADVGLPVNSPDRLVWRFAQERRILLLTENRNRKGADSLVQTIEEEGNAVSLPVLTIGNLRRMDEPDYRRRCAARLLDVVLFLDHYLGTGRIFIP
jgi:hypothetical protein